MRKLLRRFSYWIRRRRIEDELAEEIELHRLLRQEQLERSGSSEAAAVSESRRALGHTLLARESARGIWIWPWLDELCQDVRYSLRSLRKSPGFTLAALLTLTIGIGVNTAVFSVTYGLLLRPLPYDEPQELLTIDAADGRGTLLSVPAGDQKNLEKLTQSFDSVAFQMGRIFEMQSGGDVHSILEAAVSQSYFKVLRVSPSLGRDFNTADNEIAAPETAIISHDFLLEQMGNDPNVVGRVIQSVTSESLTIVGVLPATFRAPDNLGAPRGLYILAKSTGTISPRAPTRTYARLKPGVSLTQAQSDLTSVQDRVLTSDLMMYHRPLVAKPLLESFVANSRTAILVLAGTAMCVLLVCIVNLIGIELARLTRSQNELSIRAALGASRWRLVRMVLVKTGVLGVSGGLLGMIVVAASHGSLLQLMSWIPRKDDIRVDGAVFLFSLGLSLISSLAIAVIPAIRAGSANINEMVRAVSPSYTENPRSKMISDTVTAIGTAFAIVLVIAAGLLVRNLWAVMSTDLGFTPQDVLSIQISLPASPERDRTVNTFKNILSRLESTSGVTSVALASHPPTSGGSFTAVEPASGSLDGRPIPIQRVGASTQYFSTLRVPLLAGRTFSTDEVRDIAPVAVVSAGLAEKLWPAKNPLGQTFHTRMRNSPDLTVIGVVGDIQGGLFDKIQLKSEGISAQKTGRSAVVSESSVVYIPATSLIQENQAGPFGGRAVVLARTSRDVGDIVKVIANVEPKATVEPGTMDDVIRRGLEQQRFQTVVVGCFGLIALFLTASGTYTVVAYSVARRTREIGIRIAVGASAPEVFLHIFRQALMPPVIGILAGCGLSLAIRQVITSYLYSIDPGDAPTYVAVCAVMFLVTFFACAIPARRATRSDPVAALRSE